MPRLLPRRFWLELIFAAMAGILAVLTLITREWIEIIFGVDPDHGDGSLEWFIVLGSALIAVSLSVRARIDWRRARVAEG